MPTPSKRAVSPRKPKSAPLQEANGAIQAPNASSEAPVAPTSSTPAHTTHGGYTPIVGPILNAQQLIRGRNIGKGAIGSFETAAAYVRYLKAMSTAELHRHAVDEAHIVAIDDRERLIRRLEAEWTGVVAREAHGGPRGVPKRPQFTPEQMSAQNELRTKMLKGRDAL